MPSMVDVGDTQTDFAIERVFFRSRLGVDVVKTNGVYPFLRSRRPKVNIPLATPVFSVTTEY